ncbi:MAG TPA: hypothetical protein VK656_00290 [Candidatus Acidoferrum sp.]|nr:hypothetical protein [Candidatus Acidoferrum sp.]
MVAAMALAIAGMPIEAAASTSTDASITTAADGTTVATGTLVVAHADDFKTGTSRFWYSLRTDRATLKLAFIGPGPRDSGGATVQVRGDRVGNTIHIAPTAPEGGLRVVRTARTTAEGGSIVAAAVAPDAQAAPADVLASAPESISVAVVLVNFTNDTRQTVSPATANSIVFSSGGSVANFFAEESRGAVSMHGDVLGWYTLPDTNAGCNWQQWGNDAEAAALAAGHDLSSYDHVIFAWPGASSCGWAGLGYMPGPYTYNNGSFSLRVLAHEMSHNLGVNHASSLTCTSGSSVVALSSSCTYSEYGDPFTVMGSGSTFHNDGEQLGELGWLGTGELKTVVADGGTYSLKPVLGSTPGSAMVLRIARGDGTSFYLDVRTPYGPYFDTFAPGSPAVGGVMIRLSPDAGTPQSSPQNTKLIDTTPETSTFADAALTVGRTLTDPVSHITITTVSLDATGATVQIATSVGPTAPSAFTATAAGPNAVDLSWQPASTGATPTGYRLFRGGVQIAAPAASVNTFHDAGLTPHTAYQYSISAIDAANDVSPAATTSVTTPPVPPSDPNPPTAPVGLAGHADSATAVTLTWSAGTDDQGIAGYRIERDGVVTGTTSGLTWTDTQRMPATTYTYLVVTVDLASNLSPAATVAVTTLADTSRPTRPGALHMKRLDAGHERLSWSAATDNVGVAKYIVYRIGRSTPVLATTGRTVTIRRVAGARYYVRAMDASGNKSATSTVARAV